MAKKTAALVEEEGLNDGVLKGKDDWQGSQLQCSLWKYVRMASKEMSSNET